MTNNTYATINGTLNAKTGIKLDSQTALHAGCSVKTSGDVYITNGATIETLYLKAANYYQDSSSKMVLHDQSMVEVDDIYQNLNNTLGCTDLGDKDGVAVIKCRRIIYNAPSKKAEASSYQDWNTTKKTVDCNILTTSGDNATIIVDCSDGIYTNSDTNKKLTEVQRKRIPKDKAIMPISSSRMIQKPRTMSSRRLSAILMVTMQTKSLQRSQHST